MAAAQAEREFDEEVLVFLFAAESEVFAWRPVAKRILPVERRHDRLDFARVESACIESTDDRAHARSRDCVDGDMKVVQDFEYSNVRGATRPATGQNEAYPRPVGTGQAAQVF